MITKSRLASHPKYAVFLHRYNEILKRDGRVNNLKFYREVIQPDFPEYHVQSWYQFVNRFKTEAGLIAARPSDYLPEPMSVNKEAERSLMDAFLSNDEATQIGISNALNLGAAFYRDLLNKYRNNPELLTPFERKTLSDALHKAMKSQDSRIHALGKVREDARETARFDRAFKNAAGG